MRALGSGAWTHTSAFAGTTESSASLGVASGRRGGDEREEREGVEHDRSLWWGGCAVSSGVAAERMFVAARPWARQSYVTSTRTIPDGA